MHLAHRDGAHLVGLYAQLPQGVPSFVEAELAASRGQRTPAAAFRLAGGEPGCDPHEWAHTWFHRHATQAGIPAEWHCSDGDPGDCAVLYARCSDLVILGQAAAGDAGPVVLQVLLESGRPVLVVPAAGTFPILGTRIVIAWNGSREAARAVHDALPLLRAAAQVTVLTIEGSGGTIDTGPDVTRHLARHGIHAEAKTDTARDVGIAPLLLSRLADLQADLLVMGGYGHSRIRETVLGGVTREILQTMTVPTLLSH